MDVTSSQTAEGEKMSEKKRYYEITPGFLGYDTTAFLANPQDSWKTALEIVEEALDDQWMKMEDEGSEWSDIKVTIKCIEMTDEEFDELGD